jgi:hypothetical protein
MLKKYIVITSVFQPTEAIRAFSSMSGYRLVVVGDAKTPERWECPNVEYVSLERQRDMPTRVGRLLPLNHYCRKMMGYLYAMEKGADIIIDSDDDNIPFETWEFPEMDGVFEYIQPNHGFINMYERFSDRKIWPRGLPLRLINDPRDFESDIGTRHCNVGVWQGLADGDPDVDAIYRMTYGELCCFAVKQPCVLGAGTISPFNSQNAAFRKAVFPLLYLPISVTFRFTDILRGLVAQPIMWLYGYHLGFTSATVTQERNPHDLMKDFISEIPMYTQSEEVFKRVSEAISPDRSIADNLRLSYKALFASGIVADRELESLDAWLNDVARLC